MSRPATPYYVHRKDANGQWFWVYYASDGKAIAQSSESYAKRDDCIRSMDIMKYSANSAVLYLDD